MQILKICLYNAAGDTREVSFKTGQLNIVTGESKSGKSALLDIVEYCLGRDSIQMAVGPITSTVVWYAVIFELPSGGNAFVARPAPQEGRASSSRGMLEFGEALELPALSELAPNIDTTALREQLGQRIGISENSTEVPSGSLRSSFSANLGHAAFLCLQGQDEVASKRYLFHRQGEDGIKQAIVDTLPYFLGAVPRDQALQQARLREARRDVGRATAALTSARLAADLVEVQLSGLWSEASIVGLVPESPPVGRDAMLSALQSASVAPAGEDARPDRNLPATDADDRLSDLDRRRWGLRDRLKVIASERRLLLDTVAEADAFRAAAETQAARLEPLGLAPAGPQQGDAADCPVCGSHLDEPDPSVEDLQAALADLRVELQGVDAARPSQRTAIANLEDEAASLRDELRSLDLAVHALAESDETADAVESLDRLSFARGRISATLGLLRSADQDEVSRLEQLLQAATRRVESLESALDQDEVQRQLDSRLLEISRDMTGLSRDLKVEHTGEVWLDLKALTVVTQTDQGPAPLTRVGSGENWVGAHLSTHLALHRYFVRHSRPVPRFVMFDQPTQAFYPSEVERSQGVPAEDADRIAVERMFRLLQQVAEELAPQFQIIVCDHANLPEPWFQDAVVADWRNGDRLIPAEWIATVSATPADADDV